MKTKINQFIILSLMLILSLRCTRNTDRLLNSIPVLTTADIIDITTSTAMCGGNITDNGGADVTARGVCWSTSVNPTIANTKTTDGSGSGAYSSSIAGLSNNTTYHVRAYAINSAGTAYGNEVSFTTGTAITTPTITTTALSEITATTASSGGNITNNGGANVTARGVCWSTSANPTTANTKTIDGSGSGAFTSSITGLSNNTTYHVRAYATNSAGTAYGDDISFTTTSAISNCGTVTDIDGNVYQTVTIGTQCWMKENLQTTRYNDGTVIPYEGDRIAWFRSTNGAWCLYDNDVNNSLLYGKLYNWQAVNTGKLAPVGWHVPTEAEWTTLITFLGGNAGDKMRNNNYWLPSSWVNNTNSSGFTALPNGYFYVDATITPIGYSAKFWSSTQNNSSVGLAKYCFLYFQNSDARIQNQGLGHGMSIRCIKD